MPDNHLRTRITAAWLQHDGPYSQYKPDTDLTVLVCDCGWIGETDEYQEYADHFADALIRELGSDCIYHYACACGDFWFDQSERMQRFALLHSRLHQTKDEHDKDGVWGCGQSDCKACY